MTTATKTASPAAIPPAAVDALRVFVAQLTTPEFEALANMQMPCGHSRVFDVMLALLNQVTAPPPAVATPAPAPAPAPEIAAMGRKEASMAARVASYNARDKVRDRDLSAAHAYNARGVACVMHALSLASERIKKAPGSARAAGALADACRVASEAYEVAYRDEATLDAALEAQVALSWRIIDVDAWVRETARPECC